MSSSSSSWNNDHAQLFARIRLHGLTKSSDGTPCPVDLQRKISFPMPADRVIIREIDDNNEDLSALSLAPKYDIEARVCFDRPIFQDQDVSKHFADPLVGWYSMPKPDGALGDGRAGIVYPLEILSWKQAGSQISDQSQQIPEPPTLPPLCVKVAKPSHARNHAREAWFYEQFDKIGLTRLIAPRCYGVFHASGIPDDLTIDIPGYDYYRSANTPVKGRPGLYTASMFEEDYDEKTNTLSVSPQYFLDDLENSHTNSEWTLFRETPEVTTLTVLVMDMLGPSIKVKEFPTEWKEEINDIFDHLLPLQIIHDDLRLDNFLQVPPHLQIPCPMHPNTVLGHRWNITDWESGRILYKNPVNRPRPGTLRANLYHDYRYLGGQEIPNFTNLSWIR